MFLPARVDGSKRRVEIDFAGSDDVIRAFSCAQTFRVAIVPSLKLVKDFLSPLIDGAVMQDAGH